MRAALLLTTLLLVTALAPTPVAAQAADVTDVTFTHAGLNVEILDGDGNLTDETIQFNVTAANAQAVTVQLTPGSTCTVAVLCQTFELAATKGTGNNWTATVGTLDKRLVVADWTIRAVAVGGGVSDSQTAASALKMRATNDASAPAITVPAMVAGEVILGAGEDLDILATDASLARVEYTAPHRVGAGQLLFPYSVAGSKFTQGDEAVQVTAYDRALKSNTLPIAVHRDTLPAGIDAIAPGDLIRDVGFTLNIAVEDISAHEVDVIWQNTTQTFSGVRAASGLTLHTASLVSNMTGNQTVRIVVTDEVGNIATRDFTFLFVEPSTDLAVTGISFSPIIPLAGDLLDVTVNLAQLGGDKSQVGSVTLTLDSQTSQTEFITLAIDTNGSLSFPVRATIGDHSLVAIIVADDPDAVETDFTNNKFTLNFTAYFGKVVHGGNEYYMKVGLDGLPSSAVTPDGTSYNLTLVEVADREVWQFTVGTVDLHWDPLTRVTTIPVATTETEPEESSNTPGFGLLGALALLAAVAVARNRRH